MSTNGRHKPPQGGRRSSRGQRMMDMAAIDELRRRIESLENHHSGIGSEVAVVKAEVGSMQRDINYLRTSAETMGSKLDAVLTNITAIQTRNGMTPTRDPFDFAKTLGSIVVSIGAVIGMVVAGVTYIARGTDTDVRNALAEFHRQHQQTIPRTQSNTLTEPQLWN